MLPYNDNVLLPVRNDARDILRTAAEVFQGDAQWETPGDAHRCQLHPFSELTRCDICEFHLAVDAGEICFTPQLAESILRHEDAFRHVLTDAGIPRENIDRQAALVDQASYLAFCVIPALVTLDRYLDAVKITRQLFHRLTWSKHRAVLGAGHIEPNGAFDTRFL